MKAQAPVRVTPPADTPATIGEVKEACRVGHDEQDAMFERFVAAATAALDGWGGSLGRCLVTQVWSQSFDEFPSDDTIRLPFPDVSAVTVTYRDVDGVSQTFSSGSYRLAEDERGPMIILADGQSWPATSVRPDAVTVQMTAGYGDPADVHPEVRHAIIEHAKAMYDGDEDRLVSGPAYANWVARNRWVAL